MGREYKSSLFAHLWFAVMLQYFGVIFAFPMAIMGLYQAIYPDVHFQYYLGLKLKYFDHITLHQTIVALIASIGFFITTLGFLTSDAFFSSLYGPFFAKWAVRLEKDGMYGYTLFRMLTLRGYGKLCNWEDIVRVRKKGWNFLDFGIHRIYFHLKNRKKFAIYQVGNSPLDEVAFKNTENVDERNRKYSVYTLLAYVLQRVPRERFQNFSKKYWEKIEASERELQWLIPIDEARELEKQKELEAKKKRLAVIAAEEEEERKELEKERLREEKSPQ